MRYAPLRRDARWLLAVLLVVLAVPAFASAHATLMSSTPEDGGVVQTTPKQVQLSFNEPVETSLGSVRIFDGEAREITVGQTTKAGSDAVSASIDGALSNGTYTVSWRVLSADGHPLDGSFVFHVGAPGANPGGVGDQVTKQASSALRGASSVAQFLNILLVVALLGTLIALLFLFAGTGRDVERRMWHVVAGLGFGLSIAAGATVLLQAAIVNGSGVGAATQGDVLSAVLQTRFGQVRLAQLIIAEVIAISAVWAATVRSKAFTWAIGALGAVLAVTPGLSGHAGVNGTLAAIADTGHVLAASAWVGGLGAITIGALLAGKGHRRAFGQVVLPRFSTVALVSVGVLIVTGTVGSLANVNAFSQLWETTYGKVLLAKIAIALVLIGFGAVSRIAVRRLGADGGPAFVQLRRTLPIEIGLMVVAIALTSVLVGKPPAKASAAQTAAVPAQSVTIGDVSANLHVTPARVGENRLEVTLTSKGTPADVDEVTITATPAGGAIAPFKLTAARTAPGAYGAGPLQAAQSGPWTFDIDVRRGEFDLQRGTVTIAIRKAGS